MNYELEKPAVESDDDILYVIKLSDEESLEVTRASRNAMDLALSWTQNVPSPFHRCEAVALAFCKLLGKDMIEYIFTMSREDIEDRGPKAGEDLPEGTYVDWLSISPTDTGSFPKRNQPSDDDYDKVRAVYKQLKMEKDAVAKSMGHLKSTIQAWTTFRGHLTSFRDWAAIYKCIHPTYTPEMLMDQMKADLKFLASVPLINAYLATKVTKVRTAIKNKRKRDEINAEKQAVKEQTKKAAKVLKRATSEKTKTQQAIANLKEDSDKDKERAKRNRPILQDKITAAEKKISDASQTIDTSKNKLESLRKAATKMMPWKNAKVQTRISDRNNVNLVFDKETPSQKAERLGDGYLPPRRLGTGRNWEFSDPGEDWKSDKGNQLHLLGRLAEMMRIYEIIPTNLDFPRFIAVTNSQDLSFTLKLFFYCMYHICWGYCGNMDDGFKIALELGKDDYISPAPFIDGFKDLPEADTPEARKVTIQEDALKSVKRADLGKELTEDQMKALIEQLQETAAAWRATEASFPSTFQELKELPNLQIEHAREMAYQCFGYSTITISKHTRKMAIALDLVDWEDCGIKNKCSTKLTKIRDKYVLMSLSSWLPTSQKRKFQLSIDPIGAYVGPSKVGTFGRVRDIIRDHFSKKEQTSLMGMVNDIIAFYKYHKSGGRERVVVGKQPALVDDDKEDSSDSEPDEDPDPPEDDEPDPQGKPADEETGKGGENGETDQQDKEGDKEQDKEGEKDPNKEGEKDPTDKEETRGQGEQGGGEE